MDPNKVPDVKIQKAFRYHTGVDGPGNASVKLGDGALFAGGPVISNLERRFTMGNVADQRTVYAQCGQCGGSTYGKAKDEGPVVACEKCGPCGSYRVGVDPAKAGSEETVLHEWRTSPTYTAAELAGIDDDYVRKHLGLSGGAPGRYHTVVTIDGKAHSVPIAPGDSHADVERKVRAVLGTFVAGRAVARGVCEVDDDTFALAAGGPEDVCDPQHILGATLIGKKTGRDFYVESFSAGRYVLKHHCPLRQEDQREDHDWRSIWDHFKRAKGAGFGVAPKRVVVLKRGHQYVSEVDRPNREKGWTCTYVGPAMTDGLHKFELGGEVFIFSGDGWAPKSNPSTSTRAVAEATYTTQPPQQRPFTFEGMTRAGVMQTADEMAAKYGLRLSRQAQHEEVWHIEVGDTVQYDGAAACEALLRDLMRALPPFDRASCTMALRIDHEGGAFASNRLNVEWWPLQRKLEAALSAQVPARPIAEASVANAAKREQEAESLRFELAKPPEGYSVAVWHAYLATIYEKAEKMQPIDLVAKRFDIEAGRVEIPRRLLAADGVRMEKPVHAYRFSADGRGGR